MRKMLKNKKGFTLVELMIVVVIMAILVAVAIPIYNAVTKGVEKNACQANMRVITENFNAFPMTGNNGGAFNWGDIEGTYTLDGATNTVTSSATGTGAPTTEQLAEFAGMFKEGLPVCPTDDDADYTIEVADDTFTVHCNCNEEGIDHNADADAGEGEGGGA